MRVPSTHDFQFIAGNLALDFVNTVGNRLGKQRDYFRDTSDFRRWARLAGLLSGHNPLSISDRQLDVIREVREELHHLFRPAAISRNRALTQLNARLARVAAKRQLRRKRGDVEWIWNTRPGDPDCVLAPVLISAAQLLVSGPSGKVRECQDETCGWLFLDRSRAGRRRWCSMTDCGNRAKVRSYYRRQRELS